MKSDRYGMDFIGVFLLRKVIHSVLPINIGQFSETYIASFPFLEYYVLTVLLCVTWLIRLEFMKVLDFCLALTMTLC